MLLAKSYIFEDESCDLDLKLSSKEDERKQNDCAGWVLSYRDWSKKFVENEIRYEYIKVYLFKHRRKHCKRVLEELRTNRDLTAQDKRSFRTFCSQWH